MLNSLNSTKKILLTALFFGTIALANATLGAVLCILALPLLTAFSFSREYKIKGRLARTLLSLIAGFIAVIPGINREVNQIINSCNKGDVVACRDVADNHSSSWDEITSKEGLALINDKKKDIAAEKALEELQKVEKQRERDAAKAEEKQQKADKRRKIDEEQDSNSKSDESDSQLTNEDKDFVPLGVTKKVRGNRTVLIQGIETYFSISSEFLGTVTSDGGKLVAVYMKLGNTGTRSGDMTFSSFQLTDSSNRKYEPLDDFEDMVIINSWIEDRGLKYPDSQMFPGGSIETVIVFRTPQDATGFKINVNNTLFQASR